MKKDLPPVLSVSIAENVPSGHRRIPDRRNFTYARNESNTYVATDGRRTGLGIGFQTPYFSVIPKGSDVQMFWVGKNVDEDTARKSLRADLRKESRRGHIDVVLLTGGEHLHPATTGATRPVNEDELRKYGNYDKTRDVATEELLQFVEERNSTLIAICRGSQLAVNYYSRRQAVPGDHGQNEHTFLLTPDGPVLKKHKVKNVLSQELQNLITIPIPQINEVNSAHAQGYRLSDISADAMKTLNDNGWFLWLVADIDGVDPKNQVAEGWLRLKGRTITGIATQFHPERQHDEDGKKVKDFMQHIILSNKRQGRN